MTELLRAALAPPDAPAIDLTLRGGDLCVIAGEALSGKSRLLAVLAGIIAPDTGVVEHARPGACNLVPQHIALVAGISVADNIQLASIMNSTPGPPRDWYDEVIDRLDLREFLERRPDQTSYGQQHRTMLARSLCARPDVLLADEPFDHQDPEMADEIARLMSDYAAAGHACVVALRRGTPSAWLAAGPVVIRLGR